MIVRAGILCVPAHDDDAIDSISQLLRSAVPNLFVIENGGGSSQLHWVEEMLRRWCDEEELDLIVTIGGTLPAVGPSADQIVPEATLNVIERPLPGLPEAMRAYAQEETSLALLDRGIAGIRGRSLILNLPNGAAAAHLFLEAIVDLIPAVMDSLNDDVPSPQIEDDLELDETAAEDAGDESTLAQEHEAADPTLKQDGAKRKGLDPAEFADYLAKRQEGK